MDVIDLSARKGLVVGIANAHSLAWSAADYAQGVTGEIVHVDAGVHIEGMVFH